jgi:hypothetical protein
MSYENRQPRILGILFRMEDEAHARGELGGIKSIDIAKRLLVEEGKKNSSDPIKSKKVTVSKCLKKFNEQGLVKRLADKTVRLTPRGRVWCQNHGDLLDPQLRFGELRQNSWLTMSYAMTPYGSPLIGERLNETDTKVGKLVENFVNEALALDPSKKVFIIRVDRVEKDRIGKTSSVE